MPENPTFRFRLVNYSIDQFAVFEDNFPSDITDLNLSSEVKFEFESPGYILKCTCSVLVKYQEKPTTTAMITMHYQLFPDDVANAIVKSDNSLKIPQYLLALIASKTYGALRGVLMARLEPTRLRLALPLLDMSSIIREPQTVFL